MSDSSNEWTSDQLLRIDALQALESDFCFDQTRNSSSIGGPKKDESSDSGDRGTAAETISANGWMQLRIADPAASVSSLLSTVESESQTEHLTAGLRHTVSADEGLDVLSRLSRQLAALGLSADQTYQTLAYKRTLIVQRLYDAYENFYKRDQLTSSRYRKLPQSQLHPLLVLGIRSGVHVTLSLLQSSATQNQPLCWSLLRFLTQQLGNIPTLSFSLNSSSLPHPELTNSLLNAIQATLFALCQPKLTAQANKSLNAPSSLLSAVTGAVSSAANAGRVIPDDIRYGSLDLMLSLAVARGCLPDLLTILKLLFLREEEKRLDGKEGTVEMYSSLRKLQKLEKEIVLDLPSQARLLQAFSIPELKVQKNPFGVQDQPILTANSQFLFVYTSRGLYKIGTGSSEGVPTPSGSTIKNVSGTIYGSVDKFRKGEQARMVCCGDRLFWRGETSMPPRQLLVIDTVTLKELGVISITGDGSIASIDNTNAFQQFQNRMRSKEKQQEEAAAASMPPAISRAMSLSRTSSLSLLATAAATGPASASGSNVAAAEQDQLDFGLLTSDGNLIYNLKSFSPPMAVVPQATPSSTANEEKKEESKSDGDEDKKDSPAKNGSGSDSGSGSESDDEDESDQSMKRAASNAGSKNKEKRSQYALHVFDPVDQFKLVHSVQLFRSFQQGLPDACLTFPRLSFGEGFGSPFAITAPGNPADNDGNDSSSDSDDEGSSDRRNRNTGGGSLFAPSTAQPKSQKAPKQALMHIGSPAHLSCEEGSSFTAEFWMRCERSEHFFQNVLQKSSSGKTFAFVSVCSKLIIAGCRSTVGVSLVMGSLAHMDVTKFFHVAVSFDADKKIWSLFVNGECVNSAEKVCAGNERTANSMFSNNPNMIMSPETMQSALMEGHAHAQQMQQQMQRQDFGNNNPNAANASLAIPVFGPPPGFSNSWVVGMSCQAMKAFAGSIRELRFWSVPRSEDQIKSFMPLGTLTDAEAQFETSLTAFYRLNDAVGLYAHDTSRYNHPASLRYTKWELKSEEKDSKKKFENIVGALTSVTTSDDVPAALSKIPAPSAEVPRKPIPYSFHNASLERAALYANGESLCVIYAPNAANAAFPALTAKTSNPVTHIVSIFSLATGELQSETEWKLPYVKPEAKKPDGSARPPEQLAFAQQSNAFGATTGSFGASPFGGGGFGQPAAFGSSFGQSSTFAFSETYDENGRRRAPGAGQLIGASKTPKVTIPTLVSACMLPDGDGMWICHSVESENFCQYSLRAPSQVSPWRAQTSMAKLKRELNAAAIEAGTFSSIQTFQKKYTLVENKPDAPDSNDAAASPASTSESVPLSIAITQILLSLHQQLEEQGAPSKKCPPSLIVPIAVDLSPETFANLLDLTEHLVRDYYRSDAELDRLYGSTVEIRLLGLLVAVRLLRSNIQHLVAWKVDPTAAFSPVNSDVQARFCTVLNQLIFEQPTSRASKTVSGQLVEEVTSVLSNGMTVFYKSSDRIEILLSLLDTALESKSAQAQGFALKQLLMNRYLSKLSQPDQLITLMPEFVKSSANSSHLATGNLIGGATIHPFLARVYELVHRSSQSQVDAYFRRFTPKETSSVKTTSSELVASETTAAMGFLKKLTICLMSQAATLPPAGSSAATTPAFDHAVPYVVLLLEGSISLLTNVLNQFEQYKSDVRFDPISARESIIALLQDGPLVLLQPLLSTLLLLRMNAPVVSALLPRFLSILPQLNELMAGVPTIQTCEKDFIDGKVTQTMTRVSKKFETRSSAPSGLIELAVSVPGAVSMSLSSQQLTNRTPGVTLIAYRKQNQEEEIGRFSAGFGQSSMPVWVKGDSCYVTLQSSVGEVSHLAINADADVAESKVKLPFVLDLTKHISLVAGRLALVLVRGVFASPVAPAPVVPAVKSASSPPSSGHASATSPSAASTSSNSGSAGSVANADDKASAAQLTVDRWVASEYLSEGIEPDVDRDAKEESALSWLAPLNAKESSDEHPDFESPLTLKRAGSYRMIDVSLQELTKKVDAKLLSSDVKLPPFPIAREVTEIVQSSIRSVMAVLIKMNMLVTETQAYLMDTTSEAVPSENLVRVWKAAYKMRNWILQKYQEQRNSLKVKEGEEEAQKILIYQRICSQIQQQCAFLLTVVPVPMRLQQKESDAPAGAPNLTRQGSSTGGNSEQPSSLSSKIVAAWNQSKSTITLREANHEERFNLIWKHTLNFISSDLDISALELALRKKRDASRLRAAGFRVLCRLMNSCSFSCVKRELVHASVESLHASSKDTHQGLRGQLLQNCKPSNLELEKRTRAAFKNLYESLISVLQSTQTAGTALLCSILHTFSLQYEQADFDLVVSLGIFDLLNTLLLTFSKPNDKSDSEDLQSSPFDAEEKKEDAAEDVFKFNVRDAKKKADSRSTYHSAFTLLDLFMTTLLTSPSQSFSQKSHMNSIHAIVETQLVNIAANLQQQIQKEKQQMPQFVNRAAPVRPVFKSSFGNASSALNEDSSYEFEPAFDSFAPQASMTSGGMPSAEENHVDATSTDVLNVVDKLTFLPTGRSRISESGSNVMLTSLIQILKLGSARSRVVVLRILRRLCTSPQAPSLELLNACFASTTINEMDRSNNMVDYLLRDIGKCLSAPAISAFATQPNLVDETELPALLSQLRLYQLYSDDSVFVWGEELMLLRCLSQSSSKSSLSDSIQSQVGRFLSEAPKLVTELLQVRSKRINSDNPVEVDRKMIGDVALLEGLFRCLGSLAVAGGWVDFLTRVGSRVRILNEGRNATVVCHKIGSYHVQVLRDEEGSVASLPIDQLVSLSEVPFNAAADFQSLKPMEVVSYCIDVISQTADCLSTMHSSHPRHLLFSTVDQFLSEVRSRAITVMNSFLSVPDIAKQLLATKNLSFLQHLFTLALNSNAGEDFAVAREYRLNQFTMELLRRTAIPARLFAKLQLRDGGNAKKVRTSVDSEKKDDEKSGAPQIHGGYSCDGCEQCPITSVYRYRCTECVNFDLCDECQRIGRDIFQPNRNQTHKKSHRMNKFTADGLIVETTEDDKEKKKSKRSKDGAAAQIELVLDVNNIHPKPFMPTISLSLTCFGSQNPSVPAPNTASSLVYLPLDASVTPALKDKIVMIDTYEALHPLKQRLLSLIKAGVKTVILALHSSDVAAEGLTPPAVLEAQKKAAKAGAKAAEAQRAQTNITDEAAARGRALRAAETSAPSGGLFGASTSTSGSLFGAAPSSSSLFGGSTPATTLPLPSSTSSDSKKDGDKDKKPTVTQQSMDDLSAEDKALMTSIPILAMPSHYAATLRSMMHVQDRSHPERLDREALFKQLAKRGWSNKSHQSKALRKANWNLEKALQWLEANRDWLQNQSNNGEDSGSDNDESSGGRRGRSGADGDKDADEDEKDEAKTSQPITSPPSSESGGGLASRLAPPGAFGSVGAGGGSFGFNRPPMGMGMQQGSPGVFASRLGAVPTPSGSSFSLSSIPAGPTAGGLSFGRPPTTSGGSFGSSGLFGSSPSRPAAGGFGSATSTSGLFGTPATTAGSISFGGPSTTASTGFGASGGLFGSSPLSRSTVSTLSGENAAPLNESKEPEKVQVAGSFLNSSDEPSSSGSDSGSASAPLSAEEEQAKKLEAMMKEKMENAHKSPEQLAAEKAAKQEAELRALEQKKLGLSDASAAPNADFGAFGSSSSSMSNDKPVGATTVGFGFGAAPATTGSSGVGFGSSTPQTGGMEFGSAVRSGGLGFGSAPSVGGFGSSGPMTGFGGGMPAASGGSTFGSSPRPSPFGAAAGSSFGVAGSPSGLSLQSSGAAPPLPSPSAATTGTANAASAATATSGSSHGAVRNLQTAWAHFDANSSTSSGSFGGGGLFGGSAFGSAPPRAGLPSTGPRGPQPIEEKCGQELLTGTGCSISDVQANTAFQTELRRSTGSLRGAASRPTSCLLAEVTNLQHRGLVYFSRKILGNLFAVWPEDLSLKNFANPSFLAATVHALLALDGSPLLSAEINPESCLPGYDFRTTLLRAMRVDNQRLGENDGGYLSQVVLDDVVDVLSTSHDSKAKPLLTVTAQRIDGSGEATVIANTSRFNPSNVKTNTLFEFKAPVTGPAADQRNIIRLHVPDIKGFVCVVDGSDLSELHRTITCVFYDEKKVEKRRIILNTHDEFSHKVKLTLIGAEASCSFYCDQPQNETGAPLEVTVKLTHVKRHLFGLTTFGNLYTSLYLMDVLLCENRDPVSIHKLCMLLLRTLPFISDRSAAQLSCSMTAKLFSHWKNVRHNFGVSEWSEIVSEIEKLEKDYGALRLMRLVNSWNVTAPSLHLQILLELVLSARTAISTNQDTDNFAVQMLAGLKSKLATASDEIPSNDPANAYLVESYKKYREGDASIQLINLTKKELVTGLSLKHSNQQQGNNMYSPFGSNGQRHDLSETFVVPVAFKSGGRFYYEVTINKEPGNNQMVLAIGWVTRAYQYADRSSLQQEGTGNAWVLAAPGTYCFKTRGNNGFGGDSSPSTNPGATFAAGTVIGCWLDLEKKIMQWSFNGKIDKPAVFSGLPETAVNGGLYPAVCMGNCEISINYGSEPFKFHPNDTKVASTVAPSAAALASTGAASDKSESEKTTDEVYLPLENPGVASSSYLDQLEKSYSLLQSLAERKAPLDSKTIGAAVNRELELLQQENPIPFEYVDSDMTTSSNYSSSFGFRPSNPASLLVDNNTVVTYPKTQNVHLCFRLAENAVVGDSDDAANASFLLKSVLIRASVANSNSFLGFGGNSSNFAVFGLIFLSDTKPEDWEMFEWCNDFKLPQYKRFVQRKMAAAAEAAATAGSGATPTVAYAPHEPVGFISNPLSTPVVTFNCDPTAIKPAKYVTLKLSNCSGAFSMTLEYIQFKGILASHPLSATHGTGATQAKIDEIKQDLLAGAKEKPRAKEEEKLDSPLPSSPTSGLVWTLAMDESLTSLLQQLAQRAGISPAAFDAVGALHPSHADLTRYPLLKNVSLAAMRSRVAVLKYFNQVVSPLLSYCSTTESRKAFKGLTDGSSAPAASSTAIVPASVIQSSKGAAEFDPSLSSTVRQLKSIYFLATKKSVLDSLLSRDRPAPPMPQSTFAFAPSTGSAYMAPRITVNRIRASRMREDGTSASMQGSVFHQIFNALKNQPTENFRKLAPDQQVWNVSFSGEGSIDVGGPYRESVANLCADLMSSSTNLFIMCPNGVNGVGMNRSTYLPNPSASNSTCLAQFEFIGVLFGIALRTRLPLALDLPSMVWKTLLEMPLDVSDLEAVDRLCVQALNEIKNLKAAEFQTMFTEQKFVTQLSDHNEVELKKNGREILVTHSQKEEFVNLSIEARLKESEKQIAAIKKGLNNVVSTNLLTLLSPFDLELLVCGSPTIDVDMLKRHTVYNQLSSSDNVVVWLFRILHSFNADERQLFLRFVWGRNRLPATDLDWSTPFTINRLASASDESLPVSHTCFFSIDLPNYSSYDTMRKKILYAILNCQAIDVDFNPNADGGGVMNAWVE